ncbi:MAG: Ppx/GppA family phosphatase [Parvibaculum sp.]
MSLLQLTSHRRTSETGKGTQPAARTQEPFAIVDIGSNTVRVVIYESAKRSPVPVFNEKVMAALGNRLGETGQLDAEGKVRALDALVRFEALLRQLNVTTFEVVATAAIRDATDGEEFRQLIEATTGFKVRVLSGVEEAKFAALGVLSGIPTADGIVGDLGGGSLELLDVKDGAITGGAASGVSLPLGSLRLISSAKTSKDMSALIDDALSKVDWLSAGKKRSLYVVGGVWRNLARIHMSQHDYKIRVLQNYVIPAGDASQLTHLLEKLGPKTLAKIPDVSSRRVVALPLGALVLNRLIALTGVSEIVISANGVREGLLFDRIDAQEQKKDPLIAGASDLAERLVRFPEHNEELRAWTASLFKGDVLNETKDQERLRHAACILADIGWYAHPDYRSAYAFEQVLAAPLTGVTHAERLHLARIGYHRHEGASEPAALGDLKHLLAEEGHEHARIIGLALRLAFTLSAASIGVLPQTRFSLNAEALCLIVRKESKAFIGEVVEKRLATLARAINVEPEIRIE